MHLVRIAPIEKEWGTRYRRKMMKKVFMAVSFLRSNPMCLQLLVDRRATGLQGNNGSHFQEALEPVLFGKRVTRDPRP